MIDEMFDRTYQNGRTELNSAVDLVVKRVGRAAANAFAVLNRIEYDAPWARKVRIERRKAKVA